MKNLYEQSIAFLLKYQDSGGAYVACPNFPTYQYAWLRDGSFCAYALDLVGETGSADRFHAWVLRILNTYQSKLKRCILETAKGSCPPPNECLHSRFNLDGLEVPGNWGHHQLDGLGIWLWVYCRRQKELAQPVAAQDQSILILVRDYLISLWQFPCSNCWEELEDHIHAHSLGSVYAGLDALADLLHDPIAHNTAREIQSYILQKCTHNGQLCKSVGIEEVDASLLSLAVPYQVLKHDNPVFQSTYARIILDLVEINGGVHRYTKDTYYGGGEWLLLSAWLGWVACEMGDIDLAQRQLAWVEAQASSKGELPEQVTRHLNAPEYLPVWIKRWGKPATPLLWSHAQYLILWHALKEKNANP